MVDRKQIERHAGLDDRSKDRAAVAALGGAAILGPVGLLLGAGVGILSKRLHKSSLDTAVEQYQTDVESGQQLDEMFAGDMALDQEFYDDPRATDIDRRQHQMIQSRYERARSLLEHPDPAVRAQAIKDMNTAAEQREVWLEDIESRTETMADMETQRAWKVQDDLDAHQRQLYSQSLQFEQQEKMQANQERIATERGLLMDNMQTIKDSYRGKSAAIRGTDTALATIEVEHFKEGEKGVLTPAGRAAVEDAVHLRISTGPLAMLATVGGAVAGGGVGSMGGPLSAAAAGALGAKATSSLYKLLSGEDITDKELMSLLQALDKAGEEHFDNIIANTQPVIKKQAEAAGADPDVATAGVTFELTDQQKAWRKLYDLDWDDTRNRKFRIPPNADGTPGHSPEPHESSQELDDGKGGTFKAPYPRNISYDPLPPQDRAGAPAGVPRDPRLQPFLDDLGLRPRRETN